MPAVASAVVGRNFSAMGLPNLETMVAQWMAVEGSICAEAGEVEVQIVAALIAYRRVPEVSWYPTVGYFSAVATVTLTVTLIAIVTATGNAGYRWGGDDPLMNPDGLLPPSCLAQHWKMGLSCTALPQQQLDFYCSCLLAHLHARAPCP